MNDTEGIEFEDRTEPEATTGPEVSPLLSTRSLLGGLLQELADRHETHKGGGWTGGIRCGLPMIDRDLRGLRPKTITMLNAEPAIGKTTLCNQVAFQATLYPGERTAALYVSFENHPESLLLKHLARLSGWPTTKIEAGEVDPASPKLQEAARRLATAPLFYLNGGPATTAAIIEKRAEEVRAATDGAALLLVIDYLQFFARFCNGRTSIEQTTQALAALSHLADTTGAALLVIGSQNRAANKSSETSMFGGRDNGNIEYDAAALLTMNREDKSVKAGGGGKDYDVRLTCEKARFGGQGTDCILKFRHEQTCFEV